VKAFQRGYWVQLSLLSAVTTALWLFLTGTASAAAPSPPFNECPAIGADTGCAILIYIDDNGPQILRDPAQGPYENVEDTLVGVLNDTTSTTITKLPLSSATLPVFGFDGDGICVDPNPTSGLPGINCSSNVNDGSGYGGPDAFFTDIDTTTFQSGTVNFATPIAPGKSDFFSLEEEIDAADINVVTATGTPINAVEGKQFSDQVATFHASDTSAAASDYSATIDWGDGTSTSTGSITGSGGTFTVSGTHTFDEEGASTEATITITQTSNGTSTSVTAPVTVADAPLHSTCAAAAVSPQAFNGKTATFTDEDPNGATSDYTVSIDWGDTHTSGGTVTGPVSGTFTVSGTHTYTSTGPETIKTTITDHNESTTATCTTLIFAFAPGRGAFVIGNGNSTVNSAVNFWGPQWSKNNSLSGGAAPAAFKGYALNPATPSCGTNWSTDPGNSAPPPAGPLPAYMGVIVTSSVSQSGSQISGNTPRIVVVQTDPGYAPAVGHAGTGKVVAQFCP
jgi:hypothetical protein